MTPERLQLRDADSPAETDEAPSPRPRPSRAMRILGLIFPILVILALAAYFTMRHYVRTEMAEALPQIDGTIVFPHATALVGGLNAPVTVQRDEHGVPHIQASNMDDLIFAQGYVTTQDRLWQMELLRRHGSGELAAVLGNRMLEHDRLQRTLQMRAMADRAVTSMPAADRHWLEVYARGVNASMVAQREHLPLEFRILQYQPAAWTARDSLLVELVMFQDLSTGFPVKLGREALAAHLPADLMADLYPVGSWRDHPPGQPNPDLTAPQSEFNDIPLDESQSRVDRPAAPPAKGQTTSAEDLLALEKILALFHTPCPSCVPGSNGWAVAGPRTASGKPILSNDMHLSESVPTLWYEAGLDVKNTAPLADFHAAGVTLPGTPFIIAGHNAHIAWGFTNLTADVQDLYIEHTRGTPSGAEYQATDGTWQPILYHREVIHIRGAADVVLNVPLTHHGDADTPILSSVSPGETRTLSLRWTLYSPANLAFPFLNANSARDWPSFLKAFENYVGPPENLMYADDQGHIGYHAIGRIPLRGDAANPSPLSPVPTDATAPDAPSHEWAGYIPFDQLPQSFDPPVGVVVTANARVTLDGYRYPITLNWSSPYRTERIYKVLESGPGRGRLPRGPLTPADMLVLQTDSFSELDQVLAQRMAYSIDHTTGPLKNDPALHQAADILRRWNGSVDSNAAAPAIVDAARAVFWKMLLVPRLAPKLSPELVRDADLKKLPPSQAHDALLWKAYVWGESSSVEEYLFTHAPARWLPPGYANWQDFLAAVVQTGLTDAKAPRDLSKWQYGQAFPFHLEHPIFSQSALLENLIGVPTSTGNRPISGDSDTVRQVKGVLAPSERFTTDLGDPDRTTLNIVLGQSGNPASPWYMDQLSDWLQGTTYPLPFTPSAYAPTIAHTLVLRPQ